MNSLVTSRDYSTQHTLLHDHLLQCLLILSIVLSMILMMLFCTQPMTIQTVVSDFLTGLEGIKNGL